jgi:Tfp pilus assembly protein PilO|tara:strand:- start:467 stop:1156 length:690 start_codon:yes stop_codon:yes gene_type:complete
MDLNIDLKNLKVEDIKEKILKLADKKTLTKIGIAVGAVIFFLIIYYAVLNPIVNKKKIQLDDMNKKKQETVEFVQQIKSKQRKIKKLKPRYDQYSTLFHSKAEVEGLYNTLSLFAGENDLVISKIEKKEIKQVTKSAALAKVSKGKKKKKKAKKKGAIKKENVAYYTIPVDFEITGNFIGYIKFKRALSLSKKMLNFDKESIKVVKGDSTGTIKVSGTLTIVGLADDFF